MSENSSEGVKKALALGGDAERIKDYYRDWAASYDEDVTKEGYRAPDIMASLAGLLHLSYFDAGRDALKVMDAGCGTGLAGVTLRRAGFARVDGFDIAPEMVGAARETGAYERLWAEIDLNRADAGLGDLRAAYDIVTCAGVFTLGHVEPTGLDHLLDITKPGGFIVASTRAGYLENSDYRQHVASREAGGALETVQHLADALYVGRDLADYWVYRKTARS